MLFPPFRLHKKKVVTAVQYVRGVGKKLRLHLRHSMLQALETFTARKQIQAEARPESTDCKHSNSLGDEAAGTQTHKLK